MKGAKKSVAAAALAFAQLSAALPQHVARQSIDFALVDATPDPIIKPEDTSNLNPAAAIASVIAEVKENPLPQVKRTLKARNIIVETYPGYTTNTGVGNAAINAPLDCNKKDTYMGVKLFSDSAFDTRLCAAACTAQSQYNRAHPPRDGSARICRFYNTYELYKNNMYEGQYCTLYNQTWDATFAVNTGQWRGKDQYTIRNSFVASDATNPGVCSQASAASPPTSPADPPKELSSPQDLEFCVSYIGYVAPLTTVGTTATISTVARTTSTTVITSDPPTSTEFTTSLATTVATAVVATTTVTRIQTVFVVAKKRAVAAATPAAAIGWLPQEISAACSKIATFTSTTTLATATATVFTATETAVTTQTNTGIAPTTTVVVTFPITQTVSSTRTTTVIQRTYITI